ncbi:MAG: hypothetical protein IJP66_10060, partial [Kiritimatiellae bacterium]|nr:hypothetical protein [Kiritimatiellia bacterium]
MDRGRTYTGIGVSPGAAVAAAFLYRPAAIDPPLREIAAGEEKAEWRRIAAAVETARRSLLEDQEALGEGGSAVFEAHIQFLSDELLRDALHEEVFVRRHCAEWAVRDVSERSAAVLRASANPLVAEHAGDMLDVARRVQRALAGAPDPAPSFDFN